MTGAQILAAAALLAAFAAVLGERALAGTTMGAALGPSLRAARWAGLGLAAGVALVAGVWG